GLAFLHQGQVGRLDLVVGAGRLLEGDGHALATRAIEDVADVVLHPGVQLVDGDLRIDVGPGVEGDRLDVAGDGEVLGEGVEAAAQTGALAVEQVVDDGPATGVVAVLPALVVELGPAGGEQLAHGDELAPHGLGGSHPVAP